MSKVTSSPKTPIASKIAINPFISVAGGNDNDNENGYNNDDDDNDDGFNNDDDDNDKDDSNYFKTLSTSVLQVSSWPGQWYNWTKWGPLPPSRVGF